jgi:hypothetical protein
MHTGQCADHLEFDDDLILDQQFSDIFANDHVVMKYADSPLLDNAEPALSHLMGKGILTGFLNEPMTQRIGTLESTPNDPLGHRRQRPRIPFIPRLSP